MIAEEVYGRATDENNSRLYVQVLYLANRDRAGVKLEDIDLGFRDRALRGEDEEATLKIYRGVKVVEGTSLWIPSRDFVERLKAEGAVTGGSTYMMHAWHKARGYAEGVVDGVKYVAGFVVGVLEGAYSAIADLFKGTLDMIEAVTQVVWHLVTGDPGRVKDMLMGWVGKMKGAWEHRGQLADAFLKQWNAESMWDRGRFQGEVLGWLLMTILLVLLTLGEGAPAALSGIALRWPQLVTLLKTVDTLGDVTAYLGAAIKAVKLPAQAAASIASKTGKAGHAAEHVTAAAGKDAKHAAAKSHHIGDRHSGNVVKQTERPGIAASTPAEIYHGYGKLSQRQERLLASLPGELDHVILHKSSVSLTDLAALTAHTGDEFAVFTRGPQRMIVRGSAIGVHLGKDDLISLRNAGWKWSGHTHPGVSDLVLDASGGDRFVLEIFGQRQSAITNSRGARNVFDRADNRRVP